MGYSNSKLISYIKISPNRGNYLAGKWHDGRTHAIDTITIHCTVGQITVQSLGNIFSRSSVGASSNYGIGLDGKKALYVEEKNRSWCTSSAENDNRAITIEVACDPKYPYAVRSEAYAALLDLVTDICRRNGIKKLTWSTDKVFRMQHKDGCNMTVHRDYAHKSCPGEWLYSHHPAIAAEVNRRLAPTPVPKPAELKIGSRIRMAKNAPVYGSSRRYSSWVYSCTFYVRQIAGNRVVISTVKTGAVTGAVDKKYLSAV